MFLYYWQIRDYHSIYKGVVFAADPTAAKKAAYELCDEKFHLSDNGNYDNGPLRVHDSADIVEGEPGKAVHLDTEFDESVDQ